MVMAIHPSTNEKASRGKEDGWTDGWAWAASDGRDATRPILVSRNALRCRASRVSHPVRPCRKWHPLTISILLIPFLHLACFLAVVVVVVVRSSLVGWLQLEIDRDGEGSGGAEEDREQDQPAGDVRQAQEWPAQEGVRALRPLRRRGRPHHLLQPRQALRVLQHPEVHFIS